MPVVRIDVTGVDCKRLGNREGKEVSIKTSADPVKVKKEKIGERDFLLVDFELKTDYEPDIGKLKVTGTAYYTSDDLEKGYVEEGDDIKLKPEVVKAVAQAVFTSPAVVAVNMARELKLPMPIQFPRIRMSKKVKK